MTSISVLAVTKTEAVTVQGESLTVIGGAQSTGRRITSLKEKGDYAVLSPDSEGQWSLHSLAGKKRGLQKLTPLLPVIIEDLTLVAVPWSTKTASNGDTGFSFATTSSHDEWLALVLEVIRSFSEPKDLKPVLARVLEIFQTRFGYERGLVVLSSGAGVFETVVSQGLKMNDPWLSESLIQDTLKSQTPISINSIPGSRYDQAKSLVATGFNSVVSWPLVLRGKTLGALTVGSSKPHSGLSVKEEADAALLVSLAALLVQFQQRDEALRQQVEAARARMRENDGPFVTSSPTMREALQLARDVSTSDLSILIQGETGVGKEVLANWIHQLSPRAKGPFVAVNCAAIPKDLLESVLFGHKRGAFTGASSDQTGKFLAANGGTLFLDEIAELPLALQSKILRAVQERVIEPLGSNRSIRVDVRFVSATHRNLETAVREGEFREDLYFRLAEVATRIPALRERRSDIPLLASQILREFAPDKTLTNAAWSWLKAREWPGNVRELRSTLKRVALLSRSNEIDVAELTRGMPSTDPLGVSGSASALGAIGDGPNSWLGGENLDDARARFTAVKVREALLRSGGHRGRAAELLGITSRTLFRYLDDYAKYLGDVTDLSARPDKSVAEKRGIDA